MTLQKKKHKERVLQDAIKTQERFIKIASHELKTPLTSLQLQANLRQKLIETNQPLEQFKKKMETGLKNELKQLKRITSLVDDILEVSTFSTGKLHVNVEEFDLCDMMRYLIEEFENIHTEGRVDIHFRGCEHKLGQWDRFRLEQAVMNILINAFKYGKGSPIHVLVENFEGYSTITIRDEGLGISKEDHQRIFLRFERAISENEISGFGIGLYIADTIVKAHNGKILLASELNKGSEFKIVLPHSSKSLK